MSADMSPGPEAFARNRNCEQASRSDAALLEVHAVFGVPWGLAITELRIPRRRGIPIPGLVGLTATPVTNEGSVEASSLLRGKPRSTGGLNPAIGILAAVAKASELGLEASAPFAGSAGGSAPASSSGNGNDSA